MPISPERERWWHQILSLASRHKVGREVPDGSRAPLLSARPGWSPPPAIPLWNQEPLLVLTAQVHHREHVGQREVFF